MKATKRNLVKVAKAIANANQRSAWSRGVYDYALEFIGQFDIWRKYNEENGEDAPEMDERTALNGAADWKQWAYGGCGLVYDARIAERLCTPYELKTTRNGQRQPNSRETWLDVEARAAQQAWWMVERAIRLAQA